MQPDPGYNPKIFDPNYSRNARGQGFLPSRKRPRRRSSRPLSETPHGRRRLAKLRAANRVKRQAAKKESAIEKMVATTAANHGPDFFARRARLAAAKRWGAKSGE